MPITPQELENLRRCTHAALDEAIESLTASPAPPKTRGEEVAGEMVCISGGGARVSFNGTGLSINGAGFPVSGVGIGSSALRQLVAAAIDAEIQRERNGAANLVKYITLTLDEKARLILAGEHLYLKCRE